MKYSKLDNGIYGPPIDLPTSYIVPDGPTYCGGFAQLPIATLNSYGFYEATEPTVPAGQYIVSYGNGAITDNVVAYPDVAFAKIPAPTVVTLRQARLQMIALGIYAQFLTALSGMSQEAQVEAEYAATVERSNPLTQALITLFGWSESEADDYFTAASKL